MIKNYLKVALRNILKNKLFSFINIIGLGFAIAVCIVAYVNYDFSKSYESFHKNADNIYSINHFKMVGNNRQNWSNIPTPLASHIKNEIPSVKYVSRYTRSGAILKYGDKVFNESIRYVDSDFFKMFSFDFIFGSGECLKDVQSIVIDNEVAEKYFGPGDPVGKQITFSTGDYTGDFIVGGVIKKSPKNTVLPMNIILPYEVRKEIKKEKLDSWDNWMRGLLVELNPGASIKNVIGQAQKYIEPINQANPDWPVDGFYDIPFKQLAFEARDLYGSAYYNGMHPAAIMAPTVIGMLILLLASFNFVNTALAFSSKRLKEIGIRKVIGSSRLQVIKQFLGENFIMCFLALCFGIVLAEIFVPAYNSLWPELDLRINYLENMNLVLFLVGMLFFTAIAAGSYPAFYVSSFKPAGILKGNLKLSGTNPLIRVLLTFQFVLAITTILGGLIMHENAKFINDFDLGYNIPDVINVDLEGNSYEVFKSAIKNNPDILSITACTNILGWGYNLKSIKVDDKDVEVISFNVGENYFKTMGINLLEGRDFDPDSKIDQESSILVNKEFVEEYSLDKPIDSVVKFKDGDNYKDYSIVGVTGNVLYNSLWQKVKPTMFILLPKERYSTLTVRTVPKRTSEVYASLESTWKNLFPTKPFDGIYQSRVMEEPNKVNESIEVLNVYISLIAIVISCMGLFALVALNIAKRTKEIGIRKVLGASIANISSIISREFVIILLVASVLGSVLGYYMNQMLLSSIWAYYAEPGYVTIVISVVILFAIAFVTVITQLMGISRANPVDSLRDE
jgi:putative ABC transport system permease protein